MSTSLIPLGDAVKPTRPRVKPSDCPDLPFIGMEHIEAHSMKLLGTVPASTMKSSAVHFKPGDVLYGRLRPYLNKVYRPSFEGLCSAEFIVLPENERVDGAYLQYFLNSAAFVRYASHLHAGDRPRVDFDQLASYEIPLPEKPRQRAAVAEIEKQFSRLDEAIAGLQRIKANLKRYKAAVLKAAVEGHLVPTEAELARREGRSYETGAQLLQRILETRRSQWQGKGKYKEPVPPDIAALPELPKGWVWSAADQICSQITDGEHIQPRYQPSGRPMLTAKNIRDGFVDFGDVDYIAQVDFEVCLRRCAPREGDLLIVSVGATTGRTALVGPCQPFALVRSVLLLRPVTIVPSEYLQYWLQSPWCQMYIQRASGATAQAHLYIKDTRAIPVPLPPLVEQHRIISEVDRLLSTARVVELEVESNLKRAKRLRQAVLSSEFSICNQL